MKNEIDGKSTLFLHSKITCPGLLISSDILKGSAKLSEKRCVKLIETPKEDLIQPQKLTLP
jgi:hypothetical protein